MQSVLKRACNAEHFSQIRTFPHHITPPVRQHSGQQNAVPDESQSHVFSLQGTCVRSVHAQSMSRKLRGTQLGGQLDEMFQALLHLVGCILALVEKIKNRICRYDCPVMKISRLSAHKSALDLFP